MWYYVSLFLAGVVLRLGWLCADLIALQISHQVDRLFRSWTRRIDDLPPHPGPGPSDTDWLRQMNRDMKRREG